MGINKAKESERLVDAVLKALDILDCFDSHLELSLKQISEMVALNKSRVMRLCGTLESKRYLARNPKTNLYTLGPRLLTLGKAYEDRNTLITLSRPILKELAQNTGESAALHVIDDFQRLCLAREEGTYSVRYFISEGQHLPIYAGAGSKVLLAYCAEDLRQNILQHIELKRLTPTTIVEKDDLVKELETVREQGYSFSAGEREPDAGALAAPVYHNENNVCAAISIAGPLNRFLPNYHGKYLQMLLEATKQLSQALDYEP